MTSPELDEMPEAAKDRMRQQLEEFLKLKQHVIILTVPRAFDQPDGAMASTLELDKIPAVLLSVAMTMSAGEHELVMQYDPNTGKPVNG
jgi:hypothetical protein